MKTVNSIVVHYLALVFENEGIEDEDEDEGENEDDSRLCLVST